jgi:hypothetical protein
LKLYYPSVWKPIEDTYGVVVAYTAQEYLAVILITMIDSLEYFLNKLNWYTTGDSTKQS